MRIILIHGINQEGKSPDKIIEEWCPVLSDTCAAVVPSPLESVQSIRAAFYGDRLDEMSSLTLAGDAIALGVEKTDADFDEFAIEPLKEIALRLGATDEMLRNEENKTVVSQGAGPHKRWLKAIARVIETISPFKGVVALRILVQAHAYIRNPYVHDVINDIVRPLFKANEPTIVIAHSLGTVIAFSLLRELYQTDKKLYFPLFITLGSPLGIDSIRKGFHLPRVRPYNVGRWVNFSDPEDFVALRPELTEENFGPGVVNFPDCENGSENPHDVTMYLRDKRIATEINEVIQAASVGSNAT